MNDLPFTASRAPPMACAISRSAQLSALQPLCLAPSWFTHVLPIISLDSKWEMGDGKWGMEIRNWELVWVNEREGRSTLRDTHTTPYHTKPHYLPIHPYISHSYSCQVTRCTSPQPSNLFS